MRIASPHKCAKVDLHAAQKAMPRGPGGGASLAYFAVRERGHAAAEDGSRPCACDSGWERRRRRCGRRRRQMQAARAVRPGSCRRVARELGGGRRLMREAPAGRRPSGRVRSVLVVDHVGHCRRAALPPLTTSPLTARRAEALVRRPRSSRRRPPALPLIVPPGCLTPSALFLAPPSTYLLVLTLPSKVRGLGCLALFVPSPSLSLL